MRSNREEVATNGSRWLGPVLASAWAANVMLLLGGYAWLFGTGESIHTLQRVIPLSNLVSNPWSEVRDAVRIGRGEAVVLLGSAVAAGTFALMFGALFAGPARFRTVRRWLFFLAVAGGWLALLTNWQGVFAAGQKLRVASELARLASLAEGLQRKWPTEDGEHPVLGMYLAYPKGAPRTMLLIGNAKLPESALSISAVERSDDGTIRFELAGNERGAWLEFRPDDSVPREYVGGLESRYRVDRYDRIAPGWFLSRYRAGLN